MKEPVFFDDVEPRLRAMLARLGRRLQSLPQIVAIRDLGGRVRFLIDKQPHGDIAEALGKLAEAAGELLGPRAYPPDQAFLYREEMALGVQGNLQGRLLDQGPPQLWLVDRQVAGQAWAAVTPSWQKPDASRRLAFYSFKGGVGRSTAAAVLAWHLARLGHRVLILDLDLEAPGLSTSLLPPDRRPERGIVDWFVEDTVDQGQAVLERMVVASPLSTNLAGEVLVAPAHGAEPGEYLAKLGRCYLDAPPREGPGSETWNERLGRLVAEIERRQACDIVLLDARAGLSDIASVPVGALQADVLLFAVDNDQTWEGYRLLFEHWRRADVIRALRERLHMVAALVPETDRHRYLEGFRQRAWDLFRDHAYDELAFPGECEHSDEETRDAEAFSFDLDEEPAPHAPIPVFWNRGFATLEHLRMLDETLVQAAFGSFLTRVGELVRIPAGKSGA